MRVAFDEQIFAIQPYGGISRMFAELAQQFISEPDLGIQLLPLNAPVINRYALDQPDIRQHLAVRDAGHEYYSLTRYFMRIRPRRGQDIVHNTFYLPHGLASYPGAKRIVTIHDMIPEMMPETRRRLDFLTLKKHYVQRADHIICVSEATRDDLLEIYPTLKAPVSVVHHGVHPRFTPDVDSVSQLPSKYLLFVGNRRGYKDADVLFQAFASITQGFPDLELVLVGGGPLSAYERELLRKLSIEQHTRQVNLSDADMVGAYAHAEAFVFPSRFEGFGIPALEAMACGTPTVLAAATSLPEVGGEAALYFEPGKSEDLAGQLTRILSDPDLRAVLSEAGMRRAAGFTWHQSAISHVNVYREVLAS